MASRIQLAFEETVQQMLMPALDEVHIEAACEYSEAEESSEWTIRYAGPRLDVTKTGDGLARAVLGGVAERVDYAWDGEATLGNRLTIRVKHV